MGFHMMPTGALLVLAMCYLLGSAVRETQGLPNGGGGPSVGTGARGGLVLDTRGGRYRARLAQGPPERFIIEDEDVIELSKKQMDDYGHMRFGKRDQFDDYGHLRFGRAGEAD